MGTGGYTLICALFRCCSSSHTQVNYSLLSPGMNLFIPPPPPPDIACLVSRPLPMKGEDSSLLGVNIEGVSGTVLNILAIRMDMYNKGSLFFLVSC